MHTKKSNSLKHSKSIDVESGHIPKERERERERERVIRAKGGTTIAYCLYFSYLTRMLNDATLFLIEWEQYK